MTCRRLATTLGLFLMLLGNYAYASDIYIAQNATGSDSGADPLNAHSASWFNSNAVGGNTYHLCGTFNGSAGSTMFTIPASGTAGSELVLLFEKDAVLQAPYWSGTNGAIYASGKHHIVIDGGQNGVIRNLANGTALTYHNSSVGIKMSNVNNVEIKNLNINGIYANGGSDPNATDVGGQSTANIAFSGNSSYVYVHSNILDNSRTGIDFTYSGNVNDVAIHSNLLRDHCWGILVETNDPTSVTSNLNVYNNEITGWLNWQCPANANYCTDKTDKYHTDGIIVWRSGGGAYGPNIFNNYIHGSLGKASGTAYIFCTYGTTPPGATCNIYNNLLINSSTESFPGIWLRGGTTHKVYNNTIIGNSNLAGSAITIQDNNTKAIIKNNIVSNYRLGISGYLSLPNMVKESNYNIWNNIYTGPTGPSMFSGGSWYSWSQWKNLGYDVASSNDSDLSTTFRIKSTSSPSFKQGTNLTTENLPGLNFDKDGVARPATGNWDLGVYNYIPVMPQTPMIKSIE